MELQVLITTMNKINFNLFYDMNVQCDSIIANQCQKNAIERTAINNYQVALVSTDTIGLSRNRNIAINASCGDIILFADDDMIFNDGYREMVLSEFNKHPNADAIKFNIHDISGLRKISMKRISRFERANRKNMSSSGVCGFAIKRKVLIDSGVIFNENFGAGTDNYCGEDTIFIQQLLKEKIKIFRSPIDVAGIDQSESTWFTGYNEKYFIVAGKVLKVIFPVLCKIVAFRSALRFAFRKKCTYSFLKIYSLYLQGIKESKIDDHM